MLTGDFGTVAVHPHFSSAIFVPDVGRLQEGHELPLTWEIKNGMDGSGRRS